MYQLQLKQTDNNKYYLTTHNTNIKGIQKIDIHNIIKYLLLIKETTNTMNILIITLKINQLLYIHDPNYLLSKDINLLGSLILNINNIVFDLPDMLSCNYFEILNEYSLIEILYNMNINKPLIFMLLTVLSPLNDISINETKKIIFKNQRDNKKLFLYHLYNEITKEILSFSCYFELLFKEHYHEFSNMMFEIYLK